MQMGDDRFGRPLLELSLGGPARFVEGFEQPEEGVAFVPEIERLLEHRRIVAAVGTRSQPLVAAQYAKELLALFFYFYSLRDSRVSLALWKDVSRCLSLAETI